MQVVEYKHFVSFLLYIIYYPYTTTLFKHLRKFNKSKFGILWKNYFREWNGVCLCLAQNAVGGHRLPTVKRK